MLGKIYKVKHKIEKKNYAVKVYRKSKVGDRHDTFSKVVNEIRVYRRIWHKNLLKFKTAFESKEMVYIITEFLRGPSISQSRVYDSTLSSDEIINVMYHMLGGLNHLHRNGIVHRNIKPEGIILEKNGRPSKNNQVKIVSYTHCGFVNNKKSMQERCGTVGFIAPENFKISKQIEDPNLLAELEIKKDVFSLGSVIYYFITHCTVFSLQDENYQVIKTLNSEGVLCISHPAFLRLPSKSIKNFIFS